MAAEPEELSSPAQASEAAPPSSATVSSPAETDPGDGRGNTSSAPAPPDLHTVIEADGAAGHDDDGASDAGYGSGASSRATTSLSSSVRDYTFEANRRYHRFQEGRYKFPNDDSEQEREDMKHAMIVNLCHGRLHFAPLHRPGKILDLGTGTGIWAIDMGDEYPDADILGIDLSPIQPSWVPPNVRFIVDDFEADWIHGPSSFDYIHARHLTAAVRDWPTLLEQAYTALTPGGWVELQELDFEVRCDDNTMREGNKVAEWIHYIAKGLDVFNIDLFTMRHNKERLLDAGFKNVEQRVYKVPIGTWPKDEKMKMIGLYNRSVFADAYSGVSIKPLGNALKWTPEEIEVYLTQVRKDTMDLRQHMYITFSVVTGQKAA